MRTRFTSSHTTGDFTAGRLTVQVVIEDDALGQTSWQEIEFAVPPDFRTHNDCVAAALMTLVGTRYSEISFNFPISARCAAMLGRFYREVEFGPVDPALEPRRPGRRIGLNFSGGFDSTAALHLLREVAGDDLAVVTSDYGGFYEFEALGYRNFGRDVTCRTDLRDKRFDRSGRFNCAVPLLFADYLDLDRFATGHLLNLDGSGLADLCDGQRPRFLDDDLVVNAAGIDELHATRSLLTLGAMRLVLELGPDAFEGALAGCGMPGSSKQATKARMLRYVYEDAGLDVPQFLAQVAPPARPIPLGEDVGDDLRLLQIAAREGPRAAIELCPALRRVDLKPVLGLSLAFHRRYHPNVADLLPQPLHARVIATFHACGIEPYDPNDCQELATVREFLRANGASYLP